MDGLPLAAALALVGALAGPIPAGSDPVEPEAVRTSVPLPGGAVGLSQALDATHPFDRAVALVDVTRMAYENPPGESADTDGIRRKLREYVAMLRQAPKSRRLAPPDTVPLPLSPRLWSDAILPRHARESDLALAILESREAALMYTGLSALDDETLAFLARDHATLTRIAREAPGVFATFGRSFHVHGGDVVLPGGATARPLWESVALQDAGAPAAFFMRVLLEGAGRLAFLYDTAAHLDPPALRYLLGLDLPADVRVARFRELYRVFLEAYPSWQVERRPFSRPPLDGAMLFRQLRFDAGGRLVGPAWPPLWKAVLAERLEGPETGLLSDRSAEIVEPIDPAIQIDAAWTAGAVLSGLTQAGRPRFGALLFAQRVFAESPPSDVPDLTMALRGYLAFPALALSLERMGVRDPALYARTTQRAASLSATVSESQTAVALAEFQSLVAILERARREASLDQGEVDALVSGLVTLEPDAHLGYRGAIGRWIDAALLPAVWRATGEALESSSAEDSLVRFLAGRTVNASERSLSVEWEGRRYRVDPAGAELDRLRAVRREQRGNDLDQALAFCRATAPPIGEAADLVSAVTAALEASRGLQAPMLVQAYTSVPMPTPEDAARSAFRASAGDEASARALLGSLVGQCDAILADVLVSLVYATSLGAPDGPALATSNVAMRHEFGLGVRRAAPWQPLTAWDQPREETGTGWHVTGSLLGLDVALSRLALRSLVADTMPSRPSLNANERRTFTETAALMNPFTLRDEDRDALTRAINRGRQRVEALRASPETLDPVATDGHLSEWRRVALRWALENDPDTIPRTFSLLELLWLGAPVEVPAGRLDDWGVSLVPLSAGWRLMFPQPAAWEEFAGRPMNGQLATRVPDLVLRAALELSLRRLPALLAPGVVTVATNDLLYEAQPAYHDDWLAIVRYVLDLPAERFSDYISSLTAGGPMRPAGETNGGEHR